MAELTLSKNYLNELPANKVALVSNQLYNTMVPEIFNAAVSGKTSYTFDIIRCYIDSKFPMMHPMYMRGGNQSTKVTTYSTSDLPSIDYPLLISSSDLLSSLQAKLPDCSVTYLGDPEAVPDYTNRDVLGKGMHDMIQPGYVITNGVVVDWS